MIPEHIGRYEIKSELGRGGMATVYLAYDPRFRREVAIKVLPPQFLHDPQFKARFEREAQTIASLEITGIVPVYDYGEENNQPFIVMRYLLGGSLSDKLRQGPLPLEEVVRILEQLGKALDRTHVQGIIHRDIKPGNILFDHFGEAYVTDFGIVKLTEASAQYTGSNLIGTPAYMSPEQARGERDIDGRCDIYSLGVVVFQMLAGALPFDADTPMGMAMRHIVDPVPDIRMLNPNLPSGVGKVLIKALAKNREERYQTVRDFAADLAKTLQEPVEPPAPIPVKPPVQKVKTIAPVHDPSHDAKTEQFAEQPKQFAVKVKTSSGTKKPLGKRVWIAVGIILILIWIAIGSSPGVTIENELSRPVKIYIGNRFIEEIPAHSDTEIELEDEPVDIRFEVVNSTDNLGAPIGDIYEGRFQKVMEDDELQITNQHNGNFYFFPILTNETDLECAIYINDSLPSERFAGMLKARQSNVVLGYYKWLKNSNVTLACDDELIWWGEREGTGKLLAEYPHDGLGGFYLTLTESARP